MLSPPGKITFGQQLGAREAGGFTFTETYHAPGVVLERHAHECANFNLTVWGGCHETMRGRTEECGPASLVVKPPGEAHANRYGPAGARCLIVEVAADRLHRLPPGHRLLGAPQSLLGGPLVALAQRMHAELEARDAASDLVLEGLGLEFLGRLERLRPVAPPAAMPRWLRDARDRMHASFAGPLGLTALAELAGVSPSHLARSFRSWYGCTVGDYVRQLRLRHAAERLAGAGTPLAEVAQDAGFYDQSHFTNAFKRHFGLTPAEYRRATGRGRRGRGRDERARPPRG